MRGLVPCGRAYSSTARTTLSLPGHGSRPDRERSRICGTRRPLIGVRLSCLHLLARRFCDACSVCERVHRQAPMPRFSANISMLFKEVEFPERFEAAAQAGVKAVEIQFPYARDK